MKYQKDYQLYLFLVPAFLFVTFIIAFPIIYTLYISFFNWSGPGFDMEFYGFKNYIHMFLNTRFLTALENNIFWMVLYLIIPLIGGFFLALMLNTGLKGQTFFKVVFYLPGVIAFVVVGTIFTKIYNPYHGLLNEILRIFSLDAIAINWLGSRWIGLFSIILTSSWQYMGFVMVLFLAGLQSMPLEVLEAADIDGANFFRKTFHVVIPLLKPVSIVVILITLINSIKIFDLIYVMTYGGPFQSTETLGFVMYQKTFFNQLWSEGAAYGIFIFLLTSIPSILYIRQMLRTETTY